MITAGVGIVAGLIGAAMPSRWLEGLLFGVKPTDPATLASVALVLLGVAAVACYVPARRAAHVNPILALKD